MKIKLATLLIISGALLTGALTHAEQTVAKVYGYNCKMIFAKDMDSTVQTANFSFETGKSNVVTTTTTSSSGSALEATLRKNASGNYEIWTTQNGAEAAPAVEFQAWVKNLSVTGKPGNGFLNLNCDFGRI